MKYTHLFFDADNTLLDYNKSEVFALSNSLKENGINFNQEVHLPIYKEINHYCWQLFEKGKLTAVDLRTKRFEKFFREIDQDVDAGDFSETYLSFLRKAGFLWKGASEILENLFKNYKLVMITNGLKDVQHHRLEMLDLKKYFSAIVISDEIGVQKPDPKFFDLAIEMANFPKKDNILIIGDSLSSDIKGGNNSGIDTCWFNPNNIETSSEIIPTYSISSLEEIYEILK